VCAEGDVTGILELLKDVENEEEEGMSPGEILRWQDPLDGMKTGLHVALLRAQQEVVWLLLWLASDLTTQAFPEEVSQTAQVMGADRGRMGGVDIRSLADGQGRTAEDVARSVGNTWTQLLGKGVLSVGA
jgi:hypothetical protein